jgi:SAM-dependent methyltransferase
VDVGAGTGKLTRVLAARFRRVIAVEPDDAMRAYIDVGEPVAGTGEALPLGDASADAVFVASAFHWFDGARALAEFARVLRPRGLLALLWNRTDPADYLLPEGVMPEPPEAVRRTYEAGEWRRAFAGTPYDPLEEIALPQHRTVSREALVDFFASTSALTTLPDAERAQALARIADALDRPEYVQRWTAAAFWTRRA